MSTIWHLGVAVPDLEQGMDELGKAFGVSWRPVHRSSVVIKDHNGAAYDVTIDFTFSVAQHMAIEMWEAIPGTPLRVPEHSILHHIGYWVEDLPGEAARLEGLGWPSFMSGPSIAVHRGPGGLMLEPCDMFRDRPFLRDLFPPDSKHYGPVDNSRAIERQPKAG